MNFFQIGCSEQLNKTLNSSEKSFWWHPHFRTPRKEDISLQWTLISFMNQHIVKLYLWPKMRHFTPKDFFWVNYLLCSDLTQESYVMSSRAFGCTDLCWACKFPSLGLIRLLINNFPYAPAWNQRIPPSPLPPLPFPPPLSQDPTPNKENLFHFQK